MFVIANNITTRRAPVRRLFETVKKLGWNAECEATESLKEITRDCDSAGADAIEIDIQQHFDDAQAMAFAVTFVQQVTDKRLCLSANNPEALEMGMTFARVPPIINYSSIDATNIPGLLPMAAAHDADVIFLVSDPSEPSNADEMLGRAAVLVGVANRMGIPNEHIIIDPGIYHVTQSDGQQHLVEVIKLLKAIPDTFDEQIRTTAWVSNGSAGVPAKLRPVIDTTLLAIFSGGGLSSVFLDVLGKENMRTVRLLKILQNESVYAEADLVPVKSRTIPTYRLEKKQKPK